MSISTPWRPRRRARGAGIHGPVAQGDFLDALGIHAAGRGPEGAGHPRTGGGDRDGGRARLTGRDARGMGELFKVLGPDPSRSCHRCPASPPGPPAAES